MPTPQRPRQLTIKESGALAEIYVSDKNYRNALNAPFDSPETPENIDDIHAEQAFADSILTETIKDLGLKATPEKRAWEAGRRAVLSLLSQKALGSFENYFLGPDSIVAIEEADPKLLPNGEYEVVETNNQIMRYSNSIDDPIEFFDTSLSVVERKKRLGYNKIGPENYATTMKLFSDKYASLERESEEDSKDTLTLPNITEMKELATETLQGFFDVSLRDEPNYVEMTNIFAAIRALPKGVIDPMFTKDILTYTAKNMDQLDNRSSKVFLAAVSKIDTTKFPLETSAIVNMMLHRGGEFETTRDLRTSLRAIDSLQKNVQTDAALEMFFDRAEGLDQPLDLEGIDEVVDRLHHILEDVTESTELSVRAKNFANKCMAHTNRIARKMLAAGSLTQAQTEQLKVTYTRIKDNYQAL